MKITRARYSKSRRCNLLGLKIALVKAAKRLPFTPGRISSLKQMGRYLEGEVIRTQRTLQEIPAGTDIEIHSLTYAYAFRADDTARAINLIGRLFDFREESRGIIDRLRSSSRSFPALSSSRIGYICGDARWHLFGDSLVCSDLPCGIERIYLHYTKATPSHMVISLQCFFHNGGRDLLKSSIGAANIGGVPSFSIRQLFFGRRFQCSVIFDPNSLRDSLHEAFSETGMKIEAWLKERMATGLKHAAAKSLTPALRVSTKLSPCGNEGMPEWIDANRNWLRCYGINSWNRLYCRDDVDVVDTELYSNMEWPIYFTLLSRREADADESAGADGPSPKEYLANHSLSLAFFGTSFSLIDQNAKAFEKTWQMTSALGSRSKLLNPSRKALVSDLHSQKEFMRMYSHDIAAGKTVIGHFNEDLSLFRYSTNKEESLLLTLLRGLQSRAKEAHDIQSDAVSGITDSIALQNVYAALSLQKAAICLAWSSLMLAALQIAPIGCSLGKRYPIAQIPWLNDNICPVLGPDKPRDQ